MPRVKKGPSAFSIQPSEKKLVVVEKVTVKKATRNQKPETRNQLSVPVYSLAGVATGSLALPKEIFGGKINKPLLSQAIRVYQTNQKSHPGNTKTRGEVEGSTAKIFKQKGTGRARHGSVRAPIFRGGGIALGPKVRNVSLDLPKKMKNAALRSGLSLKTEERAVLAVSGLDKASGKTKEIAKFLEKIDKQSVLLVIGEKNDQAARAVRNLAGVELVTAANLNVLAIISHKNLILTKDSIEALEERLGGSHE